MSAPRRVVFDTNIFVSALAVPGGAADRAIRRIVDGRDILIVSPAIAEEVLDVLARKFGHDPDQLARVAVFLSDLGEVVKPRRTVRVLDDPADNRVLACARAGRADLLVTGDRRILALEGFEGVRIVSLRTYLTGGSPTPT